MTRSECIWIGEPIKVSALGLELDEWRMEAAIMEITQKDAGHILNWLLDASFRNPNCPYTLYERELARKLIDFADNKIGYPSIERRIAQSIQPDKRWLPQGRTTDAQDYIEVG